MKQLLMFTGLTFFAFSCSSQPSLEQTWELTEGLKTPESTLYDVDRDVIYVANINNNPAQMDGNGYISKISTDGKMLEEQWVTGLNGPKGMGYYKNKLYVTDILQIVEIDITTGQITNTYPVAGAQFLNDLTVDEKGDVYVSDSQVSNIIRLSGGKVSVWSEDKDLSNCNGLFDLGDDIVFATTGDEKLKSINKKTGKITTLVNDIGHGDGIADCNDGAYVVSDWYGRVYYIGNKKNKTLLLDTREKEINAADIDFIPEKNLLLVPTFFKNSVVAYTLTL